MIVKVCGMTKPANIREVVEAGAQWIGMIFWNKSPRYVPMQGIMAGIVPDKSSLAKDVFGSAKRVGVFVDDTPQSIITHAVQFHLDYIQLHGQESATLIRNLKETLLPNLCPGIKFIKTLSIKHSDDLARWEEYRHCADYLLFDTKCSCVGGSGHKFNWQLLEQYHGDIPFLLSGGIGEEDALAISTLHHPMLHGIDLNSRFETAPGIKDAKRIQSFIQTLHRHEQD